MARILAVRARAVCIPLHTPFVTALRRTATIDTLLVSVHLSDGTCGFGEAPQVWAVTGESVVGAGACVDQVLGPVLEGADSDDWEHLADRLAGSCVRNFGAKAVAETALLDAVARTAGMPLAHLVAGAAGLPAPAVPPVAGADRWEIPTDVTISAGSPDLLAGHARSRVQEGFDRLKLKVGTDAATDVARVRAVREAVGPDVGIRVDANQGWSRDEAVDVIRALDDAGLGVEFVEQPVAADDVEGLARVRSRVGLPIMADEAVYGMRDLDRILSLGAADGVNVKLAKCGGPLTGARLLVRAAAGGLGTMVGSMMESHIGVAAAASLVAAVGTSAVSDLDAAWWAAESPYGGGPSYGPGVIRVPVGPGLVMSAAGDRQP